MALMTAWGGEVRNQLHLLVRERPDFLAIEARIAPLVYFVFEHRDGEDGAIVAELDASITAKKDRVRRRGVCYPLMSAMWAIVLVAATRPSGTRPGCTYSTCQLSAGGVLCSATARNASPSHRYKSFGALHLDAS